jgi:hypothetical protein
VTLALLPPRSLFSLARSLASPLCSAFASSLTVVGCSEDINTRPVNLKKAIDAHQSSYTTLRKSLAEAKFEIFDSRLAATTSAYDDVVQSMLRLSQGLTGMRAGCTLQYELMRAEQEGRLKRASGGAEDSNEGKDTRTRKLREELIVLEKFKERMGPSLRSLAASRSHFGVGRLLRLLASTDDLETYPRPSSYLVHPHQSW